MVSFPTTSVLSKVVLAASVAAFVPYAVGGLMSYWITADFTFGPYPPAVNMSIDVKTHMGLMESCSEKKVMKIMVIEDDCSADGAADWQKAAAGVAVVGALSAVLGLVFAVLNITVTMLAEKRMYKFIVAGLCFSAACMMAIAMILYGVNKKIQVSPPFPLEIDFDIDWAYIVAGIGSGMYLVVMCLALADSLKSSNGTADMHSTLTVKPMAEPSVHYTNQAMNIK